MKEGDFIEKPYRCPATYICTAFPLPGFDTAKITVVASVADMVKHGKDKFDCIVKDLRYGPEDPEGGLRVLDALKENPAPKIVFTSEDDPKLFKKLEHYSAIIAAPAISKSEKDKAEHLGEIIGELFTLK